MILLLYIMQIRMSVLITHADLKDLASTRQDTTNAIVLPDIPLTEPRVLVSVLSIY
jgi:hypothetical protein